MTKRKHTGVGFDLVAATFNLQGAAIAAGAQDGRPQETALSHLHGAGGACTKSPCRLAGLCHALYELVQYRAELVGYAAILAAADEVEEARKAMKKAGATYLRATELLHAESTRLHRLEHDFGALRPMHAHDLVCVEPQRIASGMGALVALLEHQERGLRGHAWSFDLQQSADKRRADLLLTAIWQHLAWGGLTHSEIAELVPDDSGSQGMAEHVRKRVTSANARSLLPIELAPLQAEK